MNEFLDGKEFKAIETEADKAAQEIEEVNKAIDKDFEGATTFDEIANSPKYNATELFKKNG